MSFRWIGIFAIISIIWGFSTQSLKPIQTPKPRVSIITSIWNGDKFIEGFLKDITRQTIFNNSELILINANSPGSEEDIIKKYMALYPNIRYFKLKSDPGLYEVWNIGIQKSTSDLVTNANLDDRRHPQHLEKHVQALNSNKSIDLVYADYCMTSVPNELEEDNGHQWCVEIPFVEFSPAQMNKCLPGPFPVWRKSLHTKSGMFNSWYQYAGDWEMWNRAALGGSKFKHIPGRLGLMYYNPEGLSTNKDAAKSERRDIENKRILAQYSYSWTQFNAEGQRLYYR
jgi:glycosyltransferase involved in cell wall biosynthesis